MKFKILFSSLILMFLALPVLALDFPDPPVALPYEYSGKTITQAIEWQAYTGVFWIAYRSDQTSQPTSKGMTLEHWYGDSNHWLHPMRSFSAYYSWDGTKWNKNPGYSYWNVRIAHGADWQTKVRANYDVYYYQESSPYYFDWTNRYSGIGIAYADYPSLINPTLLMEANWDYGLPPKFKITSPVANEMHIKDAWITVSGTCPTNGLKQIAPTNDCSNFSNLNYSIDCLNNIFSSAFYYNGISDWVVAVDKNSLASDCVDYDDLMDVVEISGIDAIEGYPDDWNFNYNYYSDYDIKIVSPIFDLPALTLPLGSNDVNMSFSFTYPQPLSTGLVFKIKQYDENGNLLNGDYHAKILSEMTETNNYSVNLIASSSPLHYVVQLFNGIELVRQFPFGIFVSDLDIIINPDAYYLFPRLVENLKKKVVFNYYFAFYDGFYTLFNGSFPDNPDTALDITLKSVSGNHEYNIDIPIFRGSDPNVKAFANGLRPYVTAFLWLIFALYVLARVDGLFENNE